MTVDPADAALAEAVAHRAARAGAEPLTAEQLADEVGTSLAVVEAIVREGLLNPVDVDPPRFDPEDADTVRAGLRLLEAGLPLGELLDLAGRADTALRELADHAVDVFLAFVRDPVRATADGDDAAARLVDAFDQMLPAASRLVANHFRGLVLATAQRRAVEEGVVGGEADGPAGRSQA